MNGRLGFRRAITIAAGDMKQQRTRQISSLAERLLDTDAVITRGAIGFEAHAKEISEITTKAEADRAYTTVTSRMFAQSRDARSRVFNRFCFIQSLVKCESLLQIGALIG